MLVEFPTKFLDPYIIPSDVLQNLFLRVTYPHFSSDCPYEVILLGILKKFFDHYAHYDLQKRDYYQSVLWSQFGEVIDYRLNS